VRFGNDPSFLLFAQSLYVPRPARPASFASKSVLHSIESRDRLGSYDDAFFVVGPSAPLLGRALFLTNAEHLRAQPTRAQR
jgi:hypothetical protein